MITKEELIKKIEVCNPCSGGLRWAKTKKTAKDILENVCKEWRAWALVRGIAEFEEYCDWEEFDTEDWSWLLKSQPQFINLCKCLDKFTALDWRYLLKFQPQFIDKCDKLDKFTTYDWRCLLSYQPQLAKYRK